MPDNEERNSKNRRSRETLGVLRALALVVQIGLSLAVPLVVLVWLGQLLASWLGGEVLFLIVSIFLGLGAGFLTVYRILFREIDSED